MYFSYFQLFWRLRRNLRKRLSVLRSSKSMTSWRFQMTHQISFDTEKWYGQICVKSRSSREKKTGTHFSSNIALSPLPQMNSQNSLMAFNEPHSDCFKRNNFMFCYITFLVAPSNLRKRLSVLLSSKSIKSWRFQMTPKLLQSKITSNTLNVSFDQPLFVLSEHMLILLPKVETLNDESTKPEPN